jgi:hypothetical protein
MNSEVDYSLFIMVMMVDMLKKVEMPPMVLPSSIFIGSLYFDVSTFLAASLESASGVLFIGVFRSRLRASDEDGRLATLE